ncbi:MAG TPA: hypothetical protein DEB09_02590 [Candidatus Magasanikbacteria bacterium]|nr:hypothetical protein [Candidatus Magasanikbacteria bacterium]
MKFKCNPNKIHPEDKDWIEEISDNWNKYFTDWIEDYKLGTLEKKDIINVAKRVSEHKEDNTILEEITWRLE